jgi:virginiamycin B lyase
MTREKILWTALPMLALACGGSAADGDPGAAAETTIFFPGSMVEHALPSSDCAPGDITAGPDGALWFTETAGNRIGRITTAGVINEFPIPTPGSGPVGIATGSDGNLWFTESDANQIGRITPGGVITEFPIPTAASRPIDITAGRDGLYFVEQRGGHLGYISLSGEIVERLQGMPVSPQAVAVGPDGTVWITEGVNRIGRLTPGFITEFPVLALGGDLPAIVVVPEGDIWFTERVASRVGRMSPAGMISEYFTPTPESGPCGIARGPDGNLWFAEQRAGRLGRITPAGAISEFAVPFPGAAPCQVAAGPDGKVWFTDAARGAIGNIVP